MENASKLILNQLPNEIFEKDNMNCSQFQANNNDLVQLCSAKIITLNECKASNPSMSNILRPWLICSVEPINRGNICAGALGSPLVTNDNTLYGIMSMNKDTAVNKSLSVYTNVFDQISWIRFVMYGWP